ncbi:hypothetical protein AB6A40_000493 [Gnathostoma spinigerum]|uniref:Major sperm protein n=1 Tax=Gnathostoma spinigerum TaxID=75299 RepID=A0ABD6E282_9BILA
MDKCVEIIPNRIILHSPFTVAYRTSIKVKSTWKDSIIFKIKGSKPSAFKTQPVFGSISPNDTIDVQFIFLGFNGNVRPSVTDHLTILIAPQPPDCNDPIKAWKRKDVGASAIRCTLQIVYEERMPPKLHESRDDLYDIIQSLPDTQKWKEAPNIPVELKRDVEEQHIPMKADESKRRRLMNRVMKESADIKEKTPSKDDNQRPFVSVTYDPSLNPVNMKEEIPMIAKPSPGCYKLNETNNEDEIAVEPKKGEEQCSNKVKIEQKEITQIYLPTAEKIIKNLRQETTNTDKRHDDGRQSTSGTSSSTD